MNRRQRIRQRIERHLQARQYPTRQAAESADWVKFETTDPPTEEDLLRYWHEKLLGRQRR